MLNTRLDDLAGDQFQTGYSNREFVWNLSKWWNVSTLMVSKKKTVMMPPCAIVGHICRIVWLQRAIFSFIKQDRENWFSDNVSNILLPWTKLVLWSLLFYCYRNQDFYHLSICHDLTFQKDKLFRWYDQLIVLDCYNYHLL